MTFLSDNLEGRVKQAEEDYHRACIEAEVLHDNALSKLLQARKDLEEYREHLEEYRAKARQDCVMPKDDGPHTRLNPRDEGRL